MLDHVWVMIEVFDLNLFNNEISFSNSIAIITMTTLPLPEQLILKSYKWHNWNRTKRSLVCNSELILLDNMCREARLVSIKEWYTLIFDTAVPIIQIFRESMDQDTCRNKTKIKNTLWWMEVYNFTN
jgi:hypothetical protein